MLQNVAACFLVADDFFADDMKCISGLFFNTVCTLRFVIGLILCDWLQGKLRYGLTVMQFYRIRHIMIDDSTTKNTRLSHLLNREFIPKTEHLDLKQLDTGSL